MSSFTYEVGRHLDAIGIAAPRRQPRRFWKRLLDRLIEGRRRRAFEEIRRHRHLLPRELEEAAWKINARSEDSLPFVR